MSSTSPERAAGSRRTSVIAHRGASGYLPEHTAVAKALAYGLGVDFIEQDVVATRDGEAVVLHDIYLDEISDVAEKFPARARDDGHFYVIDFDLAELRTLALIERRRPGTNERVYPGRFPYDLPTFRILTLDEEIDLISGLNASTGRHVGLYPEIKNPAWHEAAGIDLTRRVHEVLSRARDRISGPVFVQSFSPEALVRYRNEFGSETPLVQLLGRDEALMLVDDPARLTQIGRYANGLGLPYGTLIVREGDSLARSPLARLLETSPLVIHPYTLRRDVAPPEGIDYFAALRFLIRELAVDALFCDHPDDALAVRDGSAA